MNAKTRRRKNFDSDLCVLASLRLGVSLSGALEEWDINETLIVPVRLRRQNILKKQGFQKKLQGQKWDIKQ